MKFTQSHQSKIGRALALLIALLFAAQDRVSLALAFPDYVEGVQIANLEAADAQLTLTHYNADGTTNGSPLSDTIPANGSKTYFPISNVSNGFQGGVRISANKRIATIHNILSANFSAGGAYVEPANGATKVLLPLLNKDNHGFNSWIKVQNLGSADATVNVGYTDGTSASTQVIRPHTSVIYDQSTETHSQTVFAATVTSDQPIYAAVIQESTTVIFAYTGFATGSANPVFPLINSNNGRYVTGLQLQNTGTSATEVTISYIPGLIGTACTETQTIQPSASNTFVLAVFSNSANPAGITSNCAKGAKFVGSAKVTANSANQPLVGIVNQLLPGLNGEAFGGFDPNAATNKVVMPLIMDRNSGYFTGFSIQNVGATTTTVNCTFSNSSYSISSIVQPGQSFADLQLNKIANKYVGSGTCTGADVGDKIVGVVNELGPSTQADQLLIYEGINP